jgi:hypothetical protein
VAIIATARGIRATPDIISIPDVTVADTTVAGIMVEAFLAVGTVVGTRVELPETALCCRLRWETLIGRTFSRRRGPPVCMCESGAALLTHTKGDVHGIRAAGDDQ